MVYGLSTWLPKSMAANGYSIVSSLTFLITLNVGALFPDSRSPGGSEAF
jgi:AAHS family benzoate transporter-like MFS transporter